MPPGKPIYIHTHTHTHTYTHTHVYTHTRIHTYTHTHTYVYTQHTHTHTIKLTRNKTNPTFKDRSASVMFIHSRTICYIRFAARHKDTSMDKTVSVLREFIV